jgi:hypothetical protein
MEPVGRAGVAGDKNQIPLGRRERDQLEDMGRMNISVYFL